VGSAQQWVEIPNLSLGQLTLSSLLLGLQSVGPSKEQVQFSVDHRFERKSQLGFMAFIYNATRGQGGRATPDLSYQARLLRQGEAVFATPLQRVSPDSQDNSRIVFTGAVPLKDIAPGRYILELKVTDRVNQMSSTQQARVTVE
jgi:hypothetical protein